VNSVVAFIVVSTVLLATSAGNQTIARFSVQDASTYSIASSDPALPSTAVKAYAARSGHGTKLHPIQIGIAESSAIRRQNTNWLNARGCDQKELPLGFSTPENQLRAKVRRGDLTAMSDLALKLIWDGSHDGRVEAKKFLHEAILRGSTCALATHNLYLLEAEQGKRIVNSDIHGKKWAKYSLPIPTGQQQKEHNIMKAYAWDLVYEMRTGLPTGLGNASTEFAMRYHDMGFQPSAADYQYACERANRLYRTLQDEREAQGLGPFDDTPPPMRPPMVEFAEAFIAAFTKAMAKAQHGGVKPQIQSGVSRITRDESPVETGSHCSHWPVPKPRWTLAELHELRSDSKVRSNIVWILVTQNSQAAKTNP